MAIFHTNYLPGKTPNIPFSLPITGSFAKNPSVLNVTRKQPITTAALTPPIRCMKNTFRNALVHPPQCSVPMNFRKDIGKQPHEACPFDLYDPITRHYKSKRLGSCRLCPPPTMSE
ncbi:hypothetical protein CDAR_468551 [Caerostris darwini]|uniref:Uncharacterized protein n=1 Tax=Caerostris darwini TaxID=1538125 RepID=A0AAV4Q5X5_9ARAC|nr:hypothetical protein CDAR_468551 [Caerostris darwini]